jgi:solute carrier family 35 protein C2
MVKASTPIFVLVWAYLLGIERITSSLIMVVFVIAVGEFLTVAGEVHFNVVGFCMCLSASVLSGARWTLVQLKLKTLQPPLKTTIATMRVLSPSMFFSLIFVSLIVERPWITLREGYFETFWGGLHTLGMGLIGATFAIAMILCEFYLIMRANAIILMLGGVIKEMITIIVGYVLVLFFLCREGCVCKCFKASLTHVKCQFFWRFAESNQCGGMFDCILRCRLVQSHPSLGEE